MTLHPLTILNMIKMTVMSSSTRLEPMISVKVSVTSIASYSYMETSRVTMGGSFVNDLTFDKFKTSFRIESGSCGCTTTISATLNFSKTIFLTFSFFKMLTDLASSSFRY